jgi:hypothetical protein
MDTITKKLKKGDIVDIIDENHCGYGKTVQVIMVRKQRRGTGIEYEVEDKESRYYCRRESLKKIS